MYLTSLSSVSISCFSFKFIEESDDQPSSLSGSHGGLLHFWPIISAYKNDKRRLVAYSKLRLTGTKD